MLLFIGLIAGTVGSLVGLGGGIIIVPLLIGLHSLSPQLAVGTSMVTVVFTGLSSTLTYMKHKRVDYKSGLILFIGSGPGGIIGSWANKFLKQDTFSLYFWDFSYFCLHSSYVTRQIKTPFFIKYDCNQALFYR